MQQSVTSKTPRQTSPYVYTIQNHPDSRSMLNALVSGVDISLVDPKLYPQIYDLIPNYILKFQDRNDIEIMEKLKFIQSYIEKYPERQRLELMLTKSRKIEQPKQEVYTKDELNNQVNSVLNNQPELYYTSEQSEAIVQELKRRKAKYAEREEFDKADMCTKTMNKFIKLCEFSESNKIQSDKAKELEQKLEEAQKNHEELKKRWKKVFDNFYKQFDDDFLEMVDKQNKEIEDLENQKLSGEIPAKFHKYSSELLNLKQRNKAMVYSKRYNEASELQIEVSKLEEQEDQNNYQDWIMSIDDQISKSQKKHEQQRKIRENNFRREEKCMKKTMKSELESSEKLINNLKRTIKTTKDQIYTMENENEEQMNKTRSALPPLSNANTSAVPQDPMTPAMFRQRALLNMKVYTKRPQKAPPLSSR